MTRHPAAEPPGRLASGADRSVQPARRAVFGASP